MATVRYELALSGSGSIDSVYGDAFTLKSTTRTMVTFDDGSNQREMIWLGEGLKLEGDTFTRGRVETIVFADNDGVRYLAIAGVHTKASILMEHLATGDLSTTLGYLLKGGDVLLGSRKADDLAGFEGTDWLTGRGGRDHLWGGKGRDLLAGGEGADWFEFRRGDGKDKIKDFDADPEGGQDLISWGHVPDYVLHMRDGHAVLDFGDGDTLVLLGVDKGEIDATDFSLRD